MTFKVLVEYASGAQEIILVPTGVTVSTSGTVLWDESVSGTMPTPSPFIMGGLVLSGGTLVYSNSKYLPIAKARNIAAFYVAFNNFIDSRYSISARINFIGIHINAGATLKLNRQAYVAQLFPFQNTCVSYAATYLTGINSATNGETVDATVPDFSSLISADPGITPAGALAINN